MDVYSVVQCFLTWFGLDTRTCQSCCTWSYGCSLRLMDVYSVVQCFLTWFGLDTRTCQSCHTWSHCCSCWTRSMLLGWPSSTSPWERGSVGLEPRSPQERECRCTRNTKKRKKEKDLKYLGECSRHPPSTPIFCVSAFANNTDMKFYHPTLT